MDISVQKLELIEWLVKLQDQSILNSLSVIKSLLTAHNLKWSQLGEEERRSIERGLKDLEEGRVISHNEVMNR